MVSPTRGTWVWVSSGSWWWTGEPGMLQFMGSQKVGHNRVTELHWTELTSIRIYAESHWFLPQDFNRFLPQKVTDFYHRSFVEGTCPIGLCEVSCSHRKNSSSCLSRKNQMKSVSVSDLFQIHWALVFSGRKWMIKKRASIFICHH